MKRSLSWTASERNAFVMLLWRISHRYEVEELLTRQFGCFCEGNTWTSPNLGGSYRLDFTNERLAACLFISDEAL